MENLYFVRRGPIQYGELPAGQAYDPSVILDMDQVFELRGYRNDEMLTRLGFVASVSERARPVECGLCGAKFITDSGLHWHGRRRHDAKRSGLDIRDPGRGNTSAVEQALAGKTGARGGMEQHQLLDATGADGESDNEDQKIERLLEESRPIFWEKTAASQKAGEGVAEVTSDVEAAAPQKQKPQPPPTPTPKRRFVLSKSKAATPKEGA